MEYSSESMNYEITKIPILVINLDHRSDRLEKMEERLKGFQFERFRATYGDDLNKEEYNQLLSSNLKYELSKNEVACIYSHRRAWQKMIDDNISFLCILEDDVQISNSLSRFVLDDRWLPNDFDLIKIETMLHSIWVSRKTIKAKDRMLYQLRSPHFGTAGYILNQKGARKLLSLTQKCDRALDDLLFEKGLNEYFNLKIFQMIPALCIQDFVLTGTLSESDIINDRFRLRKETERHGFHKLWWEIQRPYWQFRELLRWTSDKSMIVQYL